MTRAPVVQSVARLPFPAENGGSTPTLALHFTTAGPDEMRTILGCHHYLGPVASLRYGFAGWTDNVMVACMAWRWPTARMLPADGTWLELSRWCLTPAAGPNAGSRMMGWAARWLRRNAPHVTTGVSYSDPVHGHTGALYKASGWHYQPTHHGERFDLDGVGYPSGHGSWDGNTTQTPKHRWLYHFTQPKQEDT